jgi:anti-sigma-K factor RskA
VVEPSRVDSQPGWREVIVVAAAVVAMVIGAAALTGLLPKAVQDVVYNTPLAIVVLIVATGWWLWRIARRGSGPSDP